MCAFAVVSLRERSCTVVKKGKIRMTCVFLKAKFITVLNLEFCF